jgi:hypothetical protein
VPVEQGAEIARRALDLVGVRFRLHGRHPDVGLDCVGVVARALAGESIEVPCDYTLRGDYLGRIAADMDRRGFRDVSDAPVRSGDILLCLPAEWQLHFAIATPDGFVHAHAGLRRVVLTPPPFPWPIVGHWRPTGD